MIIIIIIIIIIITIISSFFKWVTVFSRQLGKHRRPGNGLLWGEVFLAFQTVYEVQSASNTIGKSSFLIIERPQLGGNNETPSSAQFQMNWSHISTSIGMLLCDL